MSKIGSLKITIEFVFFMFIIQFSGYSLETCCKLCMHMTEKWCACSAPSVYL